MKRKRKDGVAIQAALEGLSQPRFLLLNLHCPSTVDPGSDRHKAYQLSSHAAPPRGSSCTLNAPRLQVYQLLQTPKLTLDRARWKWHHSSFWERELYIPCNWAQSAVRLHCLGPTETSKSLQRQHHVQHTADWKIAMACVTITTHSSASNARGGKSLMIPVCYSVPDNWDSMFCGRISTQVFPVVLSLPTDQTGLDQPMQALAFLLYASSSAIILCNLGLSSWRPWNILHWAAPVFFTVTNPNKPLWGRYLWWMVW